MPTDPSSAVTPPVVPAPAALTAADPANKWIRPTGIPELDLVLDGGLPSSSSVLLSGDAGAGKTTLAMQWLSAGHTQYQENGVYITMTEPTTTLLRNLEKTTFFDRNYIASSDLNAENFESEIAKRNGIHFIDLRQIMENIGLLKPEYTYEDLDLLIETLFKIIANANIKRVVLDSITAVSYLLKDEAMIRSFIFRFGKLLSTNDSNILLISEAKKDRDSVFGIEEFITDGVIRLKYGDPEKNLPRTLNVKKMRGVNFLAKPIAYGISESGLSLFTPIKKTLDFTVSGNRMPSGIPGFDNIVNGGFIAGSSILLSGPSGSGKTLFALQSLVSALQKGYRASYISFEESRAQLIRNAKAFGWDLEKYEKQGLLKLVVAQTEEYYPQEHLSIIRDIIETFKPQLVVVDSMSAIENAYSKDIVHDWSTQLISLLNVNNITGLFTTVTNDLIGSSRASDNDVSSIFDQIIILRYVEIQAEFQHAILVLKMRGSHHDKKLYNLNFSKQGLHIGNSFSGYEGVFSGSAKQVSESVEKQLNTLFLEIMGPMGQQLFNEEKKKGLNLNNISTFIKQLKEKGVLSESKVENFLKRSSIIFNSKK